MVLARFLPRDEQFFTHFNDSASNALETARLLAEVIEFGPDTERKVRRLRDLEHNSTFVTPLDRDDIRALASTFDDFVDGLEEAGKRIWLYQIGAPTEHARLFGRILIEQADILAKTIPDLEHAGKQVQRIQRSILELHRLENEADEALNLALAGLYEGVSDIPGIIRSLRWGEIYTLLEGATDHGENIGHTLEGILIKYA
jgi:uncharacterized protein Yka (UPF0111/DUF47 family)